MYKIWWTYFTVYVISNLQKMRPQLGNWSSFLISHVLHQLDHFLHASTIIENLSFDVMKVNLKILLVSSVKRNGHEVSRGIRNMEMIRDTLDAVLSICWKISEYNKVRGFVILWEIKPQIIELERRDQINLKELVWAESAHLESDRSKLMSRDTEHLTSEHILVIHTLQGSVHSALQQVEHPVVRRWGAGDFLWIFTLTGEMICMLPVFSTIFISLGVRFCLVTCRRAKFFLSFAKFVISQWLGLHLNNTLRSNSWGVDPTLRPSKNDPP